MKQRPMVVVPASGGGFVDLVDGEQHVADDADDKIDHEQYPPHAEPGGAPDGDVRGEQGGEGLDELAERQGGGELVALDEHGEQRVQGHLHQGVADTEEGEGDDDEHQACGAGQGRVGDDGQCHGDQRYENGPQHGLAAANLVHQHAGGHGEDQEPEEHHGGEQVRGAVGQIELSLDVVRGGADQVDEAHDEEREHHRRDFLRDRRCRSRWFRYSF